MAELDQIYVNNPFDVDFEVRYNSEVYKMRVGEERMENQFLGRHMAKHMSDREMQKNYIEEEKKYKRRKDPVPLGLQTQMVVRDNPQRRIALYKVLRSKLQVEEVLSSYPQFGVRVDRTGKRIFESIGDMSEYERFVEAAEKPVQDKEEEVTPSEEEK